MVYIGIGSNLGNKIKNIERAKALLVKNGIIISKSSSYYETLSWPDHNKPKFFNIVLQSNTNFSPKKLLDIFKNIEKKLGRKKNIKNSPRQCDIDIISYNNMITNGYITIPHEKMSKRNFVLFPLFELNKKWVHPKLKINIKNLIFSLSIEDIRTIKQI
jgi:2-amino-4-hydroxy-6-hydroxymethyldihydropteridine diphosphokinase